MVSSRLEYYFIDYTRYHASFGNEVCHYVGVPLIFATSLGLLSKVPIGLDNDGGQVAVLLVSLFYLIVDWRLGLLFFPVVYLLRKFSKRLTTERLAILLGIGWIIQLIGHYYFEGKSPAFFQNIKHLLIGPIWVFARVLQIW